MKRKDLHLDESTSTTITSKPYFSSNQQLELQRSKTLIIQCYWRGYIARKLSYKIRYSIYQTYLSNQEKLENDVKEKQNRQKREIERRMNPRSVSDFEILFNELETWRQEEHRKIREADEVSY
jgi:pyridoxine/pyridoxamine 5'-phosphate oxidase